MNIEFFIIGYIIQFTMVFSIIKIMGRKIVSLQQMAAVAAFVSILNLFIPAELPSIMVIIFLVIYAGMDGPPAFLSVILFQLIILFIFNPALASALSATQV